MRSLPSSLLLALAGASLLLLGASARVEAQAAEAHAIGASAAEVPRPVAPTLATSPTPSRTSLMPARVELSGDGPWARDRAMRAGAFLGGISGAIIGGVVGYQRMSDCAATDPTAGAACLTIAPATLLVNIGLGAVIGAPVGAVVGLVVCERRAAGCYDPGER